MAPGEFSLGAKRPVCVPGYSSAPVAEVKIKWNDTSNPPYAFMTSTTTSSSLLVPLFFLECILGFLYPYQIFQLCHLVKCLAILCYLSVLHYGDDI